MRAVRGHVVVVLLGALGLVEALGLDYDAPRRLGVLCAVLLVVPLLWRRRHPVRVTCACLAVYVVMLGLGAFSHDSGAAPSLVFIVLAYRLGRAVERASEAVAMVVLVLAVALAAGLAAGASITAVGLLFAVGFVGGAALLGRLVRAEARRGVRFGRELLRLIGRMEAVTAAAAEEQRERTACDLHDLAGHGLTLVIMHAGAARTLLARDPERASGHLRVLRGAARETGEELATLAARMRADDVGSVPALDALVAAAGPDAALSVGPGWEQLPRSVEQAAARVVQEALTNARKHALGARVAVRARVEDGIASVEVVDSGGRSAGVAGGGLGLEGMGERVRLLGGAVDAGPRDGGWRVAARIPLELPAGRRRRRPPWQAVALWAPAVVLAAWGLVETAVLEEAGDLWLRAGAYLVAATALLWRRRHPLAVAAIVGVALIVRYVPATLAPTAAVATPLAAVAAYSAVAHAQRILAGAAAAAALVVALVVAFLVEPGPAAPADLFFLSVLVAGAGLAGFPVRLHRARAQGLRAAADTAAAQAEAARVEAARQERLRLVGELTAITSSLLGEAERLTAEAEAAWPDVERCGPLLDAVGERARASLDELRRLVAVLRRPAAG